jgi:hypothetical protein
MLFDISDVFWAQFGHNPSPAAADGHRAVLFHDPAVLDYLQDLLFALTWLINGNLERMRRSPAREVEYETIGRICQRKFQ